MKFVQDSEFGAYRILQMIGKGGMGQVYAAEDSRLHRKVALKVLPPEATQQSDRVRRFEQEAQAVSALNHPNILTIYEVGQLEGTHYIATELVEGDTLRHRIGARMPLRKIIDIAVQATSALAAAHAAGIVHRDIKPDNIMIRPDGIVKILDFGLAKLTEPGLLDENLPTALSEPGRVMGTWMYMSPEQVRGREVDARSDIWSLGVVIYELVCGRSPFAAATATDTIVSIVDREPLAPSEFGIEAPEELERILGRALTKDREQRYQSIKDMWLDLKELGRALELDTMTHSTRTRSVMARVPAEKTKPRAANSSRALIIPAMVIVVAAAAGWAGWVAFHRRVAVPLPQRQLSYSLLVQKMRDRKQYGDPFLSTGREIFENGWKFRFNFSAPQTGSLYLLNEGPGPGGAMDLTILFPLASAHGGVAQLAANERVETGWYVFDQHEGTEKFWVVWSTTPLEALELAARSANADNQGVITDPHQSGAIRDILQRGSSPAPTVSTDTAQYQTTVRGVGEIVADAIEIEHR
ncbi:MAG TPA: serine/threonine-protein kinase [Terriglobales bacterium]